MPYESGEKTIENVVYEPTEIGELTDVWVNSKSAAFSPDKLILGVPVKYKSVEPLFTILNSYEDVLIPKLISPKSKVPLFGIVTELFSTNIFGELK